MNMTYEVVKEIHLERNRQINEKGWTTKHDDQHVTGELAVAASVYAAQEQIFVKRSSLNGVSFNDPWPWHEQGRSEYVKKDKSRRRQLVIAAALLVAEIERLDRREERRG